MPELPEVERVRIDIEKGWGPDSVVEDLKFFRKDLRYPMPSPKKCKAVKGFRPLKFKRQGKFLLMDFKDHSIVSHLGMSGSWRWTTNGEPRKLHDHILILLSDGLQLIYHDPRRFGSFEILSQSEFLRKPALCSMGPDPLTTRLNPEEFFTRYRTSQRAIKVLLMDQKVIAGVGNIYACEILFLAGVHPEKPAGKLKLEEWRKILKDLPQLFKKAVGQGGTTLRDFVHVTGEKGGYQHRLKVYGKSSQPCPKCKAPISSKVLGQRSTFWCNTCQA